MLQGQLNNKVLVIKKVRITICLAYYYVLGFKRIAKLVAHYFPFTDLKWKVSFLLAARTLKVGILS